VFFTERSDFYEEVGGGWGIGKPGSIGERTTISRLPQYPGFSGPVIETQVVSPSADSGNQRAFLSYERLAQVEGPWAFEEFFLIKQAPRHLEMSGDTRRSIVMIKSIGMHLSPAVKYRTAAGLRLYTKNSRYYVGIYTVNPDQSNTNYVDQERETEIEIGRQYGLRIELIYGTDDKPIARAYLMKQNPGTKEWEYMFINQAPLAADIQRIMGQIFYLGAYTGSTVTGYVVVEGQAKLLQ